MWLSKKGLWPSHQNTITWILPLHVVVFIYQTWRRAWRLAMDFRSCSNMSLTQLATSLSLPPYWPEFEPHHPCVADGDKYRQRPMSTVLGPVIYFIALLFWSVIPVWWVEVAVSVEFSIHIPPCSGGLTVSDLKWNMAISAEKLRDSVDMSMCMNSHMWILAADSTQNPQFGLSHRCTFCNMYTDQCYCTRPRISPAMSWMFGTGCTWTAAIMAARHTTTVKRAASKAISEIPCKVSWIKNSTAEFCSPLPWNTWQTKTKWGGLHLFEEIAGGAGLCIFPSIPATTKDVYDAVQDFHTFTLFISESRDIVLSHGQHYIPLFSAYSFNSRYFSVNTPGRQDVLHTYDSWWMSRTFFLTQFIISGARCARAHLTGMMWCGFNPPPQHDYCYTTFNSVDLFKLPARLFPWFLWEHFLEFFMMFMPLLWHTTNSVAVSSLLALVCTQKYLLLEGGFD